MKRSISCFAALFLVGLLWSPFGLTQEKESKTPFFFVEEVITEPGAAALYEQHLKDAVALAHKFGFPHYFEVISTDDNHYYLIWQVENFAAVDGFFKDMAKWIADMGDANYRSLMQTVEGSFESYSYSFYRMVPEMSFIPENPRLSPDEMRYVYMGFCAVKGGKEAEVAEGFKKIGEIVKAKGYDVGWDTYALAAGTNMPLYVYLEFGRSASDFWATGEEFTEKFGSDVEGIWSETIKHFRLYEYRTGRVRPDLSYLPEEKE